MNNKAKPPSSKEIVTRAKGILIKEGVTKEQDLNTLEKLEKYIIPGLYNSKNTLSSLYAWEPNKKAGFTGSIKNIVLRKLRNIIFNVIERQSMRQQKFNELMYEAVKTIAEDYKSEKSKPT